MKIRSLGGFLAVAVCFSASLSLADVRIVSAELTDSGTALAVACDALEDVDAPDRRLYAVYGSRDCGLLTNGWEHVEFLATVSPTATAAAGTVSAAYSSVTPYLRVILMRTDRVSSASYVDGDLVAQWDGLDNAGRGTHSMDSTTWVDLTGHGWDAVYPGGCKYACWQDSSFFFVRSDKCTFSVVEPNLQASLGPSWTIEAFVKPTEWNFYDYAGIAGAHHTSGQGICFFQYEGGNFRAGTYQQTILDYAPGNSLVANEQRHLACTADGSACVARAYADGAVVAENQFASGRSTLDNPSFFLGNAYDNSITARQFEGDIYAIRVYSRVLTPEELAANRKVDEMRFGDVLRPVASALLHFGSLQGVEIVRVNRSLSGAAESFDLSLGDFGAAVKIYAAFGSADGGPSTGAWERVELSCEVAAGTQAVTVPVPDDFGEVRACIRFFAFSDGISAAITPLNYVQDGLVALWDGEHNVGYGTHDATTKTWTDLTGHGWDADSVGNNWGEKGYVFSRSAAEAFAVQRQGFQGGLGPNWTIEAYVKPTANDYQNYSGVCGAHPQWHQGVAFWQYESGSFKLGAYHSALTTDDAANTYHPASLFNQDQDNYLALTADADLGLVNSVVNGSAPKSATMVSGGSNLSAPMFYIGNAYDGTKGRTFDGEIHTVRVYSRALTASELSANRAVDRIRQGEDPAFLVTDLYRESRSVDLNVTANVPFGGAVDPTYGTHPDLVARLPLTCTATEYVTNEATLYRCVESALAKVGSETVVTNAGLSTTFDPEGSGVWTLTWRWETVAHTVETAVNGAADGATVEVSAPDLFDFHTVGSTVTVRAVGTDQLGFDHWEGDVPVGQERQATVSFTVDGNKRLLAVFRPAYWLYDAERGRVSDGITEFSATVDGSKIKFVRIQLREDIAEAELDFALPIRDADGKFYDLTGFGYECCRRVEGLRSIKLPETLEEFDDYAFSECDDLESVMPFLPQSVRKLGLWTFTFDPITNALELGMTRFVDLKDAEDAYGASQFSQCDEIPKVTLGFGVTNVPSYCFNVSKGLGSVDTALRELSMVSPRTIRRFAFNGHRNLKSITPFLPRSVRHIGEQAFAYTTVTNALTLGFSGLVDIDPAGSQFSQCPNIPEVRLGRGVTNMPQHFLHGITPYASNRLKLVETLRVKGIGSYALASHLALRDVYFGEYHEMDYYAFSFVAYYQLRLHVPRGSAEWDAYIADPAKVTPWAELPEESKTEFFSRYGTDAKPPVGLTLANDRLPMNHWVFRWNPNASGTMVLVR